MVLFDALTQVKYPKAINMPIKIKTIPDTMSIKLFFNPFDKVKRIPLYKTAVPMRIKITLANILYKII